MKVKIGCFKETAISANVLIPATGTTVQYSLNLLGGTAQTSLAFGFPVVTSAASLQLQLHEVLEFSTGQDCGPWMVEMFSD